MSSKFVIDINHNDDLFTVIRKCNANFRAIMSQYAKQRQIDNNDINADIGDAVDDLVAAIAHEADLRYAADQDLDHAIGVVDGKFANYTLTADLATVATSGDYNDLINQPVIPPGAAIDTAMSSTSENAVQNKVIYNAIQDKADISSLATIAFTGDHDDLIDNPEALTNMEIEALLT